MKKTLSFIISLILVIAAIAPMSTVSAADTAWLDSQPDGTIVYVPNFNGEVGVFEPGLLKGTPVVAVDAANPNSFVIETSSDKKASFWGGFIDTLPLDGRCYTIYYKITRNGEHCFGIYPDSVYGVYGYPKRTRIMNNTKSLDGHDYVVYVDNNIGAPVADASGTVIQEYALEVNGVNYTLANYIKNTAGEYVLIDESEQGEIEYFNADVLGLFFYVYYANHITTVSDVNIAKGLAFGTVEYPQTTEPIVTEAPDTTEAATTEAPDTEAPTEAPTQTDAPTEAPAKTEAPNVTEAPKSDGGCGAFVSVGVLVTAMAAAFVVLKKRK